ncbi:MAG: hypothetical protein WC694_02650 [Candidatus Paceibacterota bacterium]|jgi:hypothetical protein
MKRINLMPNTALNKKIEKGIKEDKKREGKKENTELPEDVKNIIDEELKKEKSILKDFTEQQDENMIKHCEKSVKLLESDPITYFSEKRSDAEELLNSWLEDKEYNETTKQKNINACTEEIKEYKRIIDALKTIRLKVEPKKESAPKTPEEVEVEEELKNLSPKDKEKIGWGLSTIGFKVEKAKNDLFAGAFNQALKKIDKKGTAGRFFAEMRNGFERDAKVAVKKAEDTTSGKEKHRLSNASLLFGNVVRYGRMVTDLTGASLASPLRYVMMGGMATTRIAEAGKEARLKNEKVIEKTRIEDMERAEEEAWNIYYRAWDGNISVSAEALKKAYLMEMPKDLQERLKIPDVANSFIQKILKTDIEGGLALLDIKITKIQGDMGLTHEQKETAIEKLLTKERKNLEDCDRIITQYGTVDGLAMAGRYAQTAGKTVVAVVTVETLALSAEKIFENISRVLTSHGIHPIDGAGKFIKNIFSGEKKGGVEKSAPAPKPAPSTAPAIEEQATKPAPTESFKAPAPQDATPTPETPKFAQTVKGFTNEGIKFENGKGGIQGILDLKKQIAEQYNEDYSNAPKSVQDFMKTDAIEGAKNLGLYDPNSPEESALIREGSTLKFDAQGNLIFHDAKTGEDVEYYAEKMFDSDGSAKISTKSANEMLENENDTEVPETSTSEQLEPTPMTTPEPETPPKLTPAEELEASNAKIKELNSNIEVAKARLKMQYDIDTETAKTNITDTTEIKKPTLGNKTYSTGTKYTTGMKVTTGEVRHTGNEIQTGGGNVYLNDPFLDISHEENNILLEHPEFAENPYGLSGEKLMQAYEAKDDGVDFLLEEKTITWHNLSNSFKLRADEVLEYQENPSADPTANHLSGYLNILKNHAELKPKSGFLGIGAESSEHFIARCLQKLTATGKLEIFEENLRK